MTFDVAPGETLAILGAPGSGKSTLLRALVGLVPHLSGGAFGGRVEVLGMDTRQHRPAELAGHAAIVFDDPETQLFNLTVEDEVAFGPESLGLAPAEIRRRVDEALDLVGLDVEPTRAPNELSGGQQQRLALASVIAMQPRLLVLDGPASQLDPEGQAEFYAALRRLRTERELTVVLSEPDPDLVAEHADRAIVLHHGRIALQGSPETLFAQHAALAEAGVAGSEPSEAAWQIGQIERLPLHFATVARGAAELGKLLDGHLPPLPVGEGKVEGAAQPSSVARGLVPRPSSVGAHVAAEGQRQTASMPGPPHPSPLPEGEGIATGEGTAPLVLVDDVWYAYGGRVPALRGVSLQIVAAERVALIGRNGSGKTTLAKHLNGLIRPDRGRVLSFGLDTARHDVGDLAAHVGYVFQNPDHQLFSASVREELAFGPRTLGVKAEEIDRRVAETLAAFGLEELADTPPALLGFAQRRLVAVAAVAASRPRLLVLDEPFAGLSWPSAARLGALIAELARAGHAIVTITHQMRAVAEFATRCVVLDDGRVLADGPVHEILADPDLLARAALAPPSTWQLGARLRSFGFSGRAVKVDELVREYERVRGAAP